MSPQSILNLADSYKYSHAGQYPDKMVSNYTYMESRGGAYSELIFVGLQYYLATYLSERVTKIEVDIAAGKAKLHGVPFDYDGWMYIVKEHKGKLPVLIKAIPEGTLIRTGLPLLTVESTDERVPWVAGFVETLLMKVWYPTTIATKSYHTRKMLERYGSKEWAQFAYHNFGDRGSSSVESAAIGGFAHYTQFMGTDNFNSLDMALDYYKHKDMPAYAVFATEHSTTTSYGRNGEEEFVYSQLLKHPDAPIMSFVADSYDVYEFTNFCTAPGSRIRKLVESRPHQKFILRPDSGDAVEVITRMVSIMRGNKLHSFKAMSTDVLFTDFGILWGDGITPKTIELILGVQLANGFAVENFVFGSGGDLMQNVTRDTQKFAIKCSSITVEDTSILLQSDPPQTCLRDIDVYKDPITAPGKKSKKGKVTTYKNSTTGTFTLGLVGTIPENCTEALELVYRNGKLFNSPSLAEIRARSI
ncbi:MAG: nicotinate phosphoribosyltransferase [Epsilonproteobacteria bacterium]|nr:MAG: nicotinate phosphoribosyltransferase [Campylobacterota bacterium]